MRNLRGTLGPESIRCRIYKSLEEQQDQYLITQTLCWKVSSNLEKKLSCDRFVLSFAERRADI